MTRKTGTAALTSLPPLRLSRHFPAARATVFRAWTATQHVQRWFTPAGMSTPYARVQLRVGGPFEICMRAPDGVEHWARGTFTTIEPLQRLVIDLRAEDANGRVLCHALTDVRFRDADGGTRLDILQSYTLQDPAAAAMIGGAPAGWSSTLENLAAEITRLQQGDEPRSAVHSTFQLERTYEAPVERVYRAFADAEAKSRWFSGSEGQWQPLERRMDFRVGGSERLRGRWHGGLVSSFDAVYHDIVPQERIVYSYEMQLDQRRISVSLATIEFKCIDERRTRLLVTEQGAFLDGYDDAGSREHGTGLLLDRLAASLTA